MIAIILLLDQTSLTLEDLEKVLNRNLNSFHRLLLTPVRDNSVLGNTEGRPRKMIIQTCLFFKTKTAFFLFFLAWLKHPS